jgi:hypothetical protein
MAARHCSAISDKRSEAVIQQGFDMDSEVGLLGNRNFRPINSNATKLPLALN